ncbi:transposase, partial [Fodinibius halophilus]
GQRVAIDGTKLKAYTGWDTPDEESLDKRLDRRREQLREWMDKLDRNDALEDARQLLEGQSEAMGEPEIMEKIAGLHEQIETLEAAKARLKASKAKRLSLSDPGARLMRAPRSGKQPSYNLQAAVDNKYKMIVAARMTNDPTDFEQLIPMHKAIRGQLGHVPDELLADTGYADLGDVKLIQTETSTRCYIPENDAPVTNRSVQFTYHPEEDRYRCSAGRWLEAKSKGRYRKSKDAYVDTYRGTSCRECPMQSECTSAADGVRNLTVFHGARWRAGYARQIGSRYGQARIKERKSIVEHVFGTLKHWMGKIPLKLRGLRKVQTEINLYAAAYNMKRYASLGPIGEGIEEVASWNPRRTATTA